MENSAVIYVRASTNNRASIDTQIEDCRKFADEKNMCVLETYVDIDSSYVEQKRLIHDSGEEKFQNIVIYSLNRLSREASDCIRALKIFEDNNIKLFLASEKIMYVQGKLFENMISQFAAFERQMMIQQREERDMIESAIDEPFAV